MSMHEFTPGFRALCNGLIITALSALAIPALSAEPVIGLGQPLDQAEIDRLSITVFPDGRNLPPGKASVQQGAALYRERCAMCHGDKGIEGPAARLAGSDGFASLSDPLRILRI